MNVHAPSRDTTQSFMSTKLIHTYRLFIRGDILEKNNCIVYFVGTKKTNKKTKLLKYIRSHLFWLLIFYTLHKYGVTYCWVGFWLETKSS